MEVTPILVTGILNPDFLGGKTRCALLVLAGASRGFSSSRADDAEDDDKVALRESNEGVVALFNQALGIAIPLVRKNNRGDAKASKAPAGLRKSFSLSANKRACSPPTASDGRTLLAILLQSKTASWTANAQMLGSLLAGRHSVSAREVAREPPRPVP
jgi:hypothetical protein